MADLVDPQVLHRLESNILTTKKIRGSWSSTLITGIIGVGLLCMILAFLVVQYNETLKLKAVETAKKNIPYEQTLWNNAVRNVVS
jgi:hypothetical protein